jgi:hypothetical protein
VVILAYAHRKSKRIDQPHLDVNDTPAGQQLVVKRAVGGELRPPLVVRHLVPQQRARDALRARAKTCTRAWQQRMRARQQQQQQQQQQ